MMHPAYTMHLEQMERERIETARTARLIMAHAGLGNESALSAMIDCERGQIIELLRDEVVTPMGRMRVVGTRGGIASWLESVRQWIKTRLRVTR